METNVSVALNNSGSLDLMHDILIPPSISFFPMALGWYLLVALFLAYFIHKGWEQYKVYERNLYRREALVELEHIKKSDKNDKTILLLGLMKRVALQHFGRKKVASLSGDKWWHFVEGHSNVKVYFLLKKYCNEIMYNSSTMHDPKYSHEICVMAELWIKTHKKDEV